MTDITLALPFALPPAELLPDLQRALQAPALAALISRTSARHWQQHDSSRVLPHEAWLAQRLGLATPPGADAPLQAPLASAVMRGLGMPAAEGHWFMVHPVHIQMARTHLSMADPRQLALADDDARALFDTARPYFEEPGKELRYGDATTWFLRADDWAGLQTASPDNASGMNLSDWMPAGAHALALRKLQNEIQMLWHEHPVNLARQTRGLAPVNSFWLWGGADASAVAPATALAVIDAGHGLGALGQPALRDAALATLLEQGGARPAALHAQLIEAAIAADWGRWLQQMQQLEQDWFAPLLAALKDGRLASVTLLLSDRGQSASFTSTRNAQRKFWRKPTLSPLLP